MHQNQITLRLFLLYFVVKIDLLNNYNKMFLSFQEIIPYSMLSSPPKRPKLFAKLGGGLDKRDFY